MDQGTKFLSVVAVVVAALTLQVFLAITEQRETPARAAVAFARAYFQQDADLAGRLCRDLRAAEGGGVRGYLDWVADEAAARGFSPAWMKMSLGHVETEVHRTGEDTAQVRLRGTLRRSLNPLFAVVARVFFLGDTYHVDETLELVREDGRWKVCGPAADPLKRLYHAAAL